MKEQTWTKALDANRAPILRSMDESITVGGETVANVLLLVELAAICGLVVGISVTSKYTGIIGTAERQNTLP